MRRRHARRRSPPRWSSRCAAPYAAEGDLDFRGTLGVAKDAPVGFAHIRLRFVSTPMLLRKRRTALLKLTERYCVVYQTIKSPPPIEVKLIRA